MTNHSNSHRVAMLGTVSAGAAISVFIIGSLVLLGWIFDLTVLKSLHPGLVSMKSNTALAFMLTGIALWLSQAKRTGFRASGIVARGCASVVAGVGLLTLSEYAFGWNLGFDQLLFTEPAGTVGTFSPGRMGPNTALNFLLLGLSLLLLDVQTRRGHRPAQYLMGVGGIIASVALVGYMYGATRLYSPSPVATAMSIPAAVAGLVAFLGLFLARPSTEVQTILTSENVGSLMARRFLLPVLLAPLLVDMVLLAGQSAGLYGGPEVSALHVVLITAIFLGLVLAVAASLNQFEAELDTLRSKLGAPVSPAVLALGSQTSRRLGYGLAIMIVGAAAILRLAFLQMLGTRDAYVTFYPAVMFAALYGGLPAGLLATVLSALLVSHFWIGPGGLLFHHDPVEWLSLGIFLVGGTMISCISEGMHRARARAHEAETQAKLAAARQREQEARSRLAAIVESSHDAIISEDPNGTILTWNAGAERMFGFRSEEITGQLISRLFPPEQGETEELLLQRLMRGERVEPFEAVRVTKDGRRLDVLMTCSLLTDGEGQAIGTSEILHDITVRKRMQQALQKAHDELEHRVEERTAELKTTNQQLTQEIEERKRAEQEILELNQELERRVEKRTQELSAVNQELAIRNRQVEEANRLKSEFLARVSHELRTPLNAILGFSDLLAEEGEGPLADIYQRYVKHIREGADHLLELINDILDLAKIEAGRIELFYQELSASKLLGEVLSVVSPLAEAKRLKLLTNLPTDPQVYADPTRFKQILYNLLSNAVKFTPEKGQVWIEGWHEGDWVLFSVSDTGVGIPMEEQAAIFEEFHQTGTTTRGVKEGTGLGLAITKRLVELQGGRIWVKSSPGEGSRFTFNLPAPRRGRDLE